MERHWKPRLTGSRFRWRSEGRGGTRREVVVKPSVLGQKVRYVLEYTIEDKVVVGLVVSLDLER